MMTVGKRYDLCSDTLYLKVNSDFQIYCQEELDDLKLCQYSVLLFDAVDRALFKVKSIGLFFVNCYIWQWFT